MDVNLEARAVAMQATGESQGVGKGRFLSEEVSSSLQEVSSHGACSSGQLQPDVGLNSVIVDMYTDCTAVFRLGLSPKSDPS